MKKSILLLLVLSFLVTLCTVSCKKKDDITSKKSNAELIVGRWKSVERNYYEVYNSDGAGKEWDADEVEEEDADTFTWEINVNDENYFLQTVNFQGGQGVIPHNCKIITLNETTFKYTTDWDKFTEDLRRVQ